MTIAVQILLLVSCVLGAHSAHVKGMFGDQRFSYDDNVMEVKMYRPDNAPGTFRQTNNLHIFSKNLVALRNSMEKQCYVRFPDESEIQTKGMVKNDDYKMKTIGNLTTERLDLDGISPLSSRAVKLLLGERIAEFCQDHDVYMLGDTGYVKLDPKNLHIKERERRSLSSFVVARTTCCCCCPSCCCYALH